MRIVLYQPGIAANFGNILRSCACFDVPLSVIEPLGFPLATKDVRRAAMDYGGEVDLLRHPTWDQYKDLPGRRVLFTTKGAEPLTGFTFQPDDHLVFGNESAGVPDSVHDDCDARVVIPIQGRSLNLSNTVAIALFESLRQTRALVKDAS
ncbi:tRNA (cytidine(34)-2'-O)-methyltransferase [Algimonas arctica]|uniref:tRNA (cytidine(34)-2'-O)-methyltransferase n=1 Tax=Algimonas arctica TaxID=1479486 RepID=A0A8J3CQX7_9PROT|nr:tRNA (cytidine(34)-2'-O)-methyltransferase [Algimonas arctica]GHA96370.1 tRNA (cytidine(34)-2'-O)-methyltransferase [Algimonas arctica]